ncbi:TrkH family potassium uptake protein [Rubrivirga sp.]|uniref:TrkH family potassium uptake protein n=1 Tax=Rubrivirga sp. TaxID=1885344 RepID=UPI003B5280A6
MSPQTKSVLHDLGGILYAPGLIALSTIVVALVAGEHDLVPELGVTAALSLGTGWGLRRLCRVDEPDLRSPLEAVTVAVAWIACAVLAAIPLYLAAHDAPVTDTLAVFRDPWNALFESMSALTSTGLSMAPDPSALPRALQWWRTVLEWVGGMGVVILALTFLESYAAHDDLLAGEINVAEFAEQAEHPARRLWTVYSVLSVVCIGGFWAAGMPLWEAVNHGLAGIATGGFTVTSDGFQSYGPAIKAVGIGVMVLGGMDFALHARIAFEQDWFCFAKDAQTRGLMIGLVGGGLLLVGVTTLQDDGGTALDAAFLWASALATCGFSSVDLPSWSPAALFLLTAAMFVGAAAGSTGGGLKIRRVAVLLKTVVWQVRKRDDLRERRYLYEGEALDDSKAFELVRQAATLAVAFMVSLVIGTLALMLTVDGRSGLDLLFEAASALGAVGLSSDVTGPDLAATPKAVLITLMWLGRLEVMAALMIVVAALDRFRSDG